MTRERLPDRRPSETETIEHDGSRFEITVSFFFDGRVGEVFAGGAKSGSALDGLVNDAAILISLLLQHSIEPAALARTVGRLGDGTEPASIIGRIVDLLVGQASEPDSDIVGTPDSVNRHDVWTP